MKTKNGRMKTMKNYKMVESILKQDFESAKGRHDFNEMRDNYELLIELWSTGELDSEDYHDNELTSIVHCFTEVNENKVSLPSNVKWCAQNYGKKVIYCLDQLSVKLILHGIDNKLICDYFEEEGIETRYIILDESVALDETAMKTLELHNGDIVELCIDEEMIVISKE